MVDGFQFETKSPVSKAGAGLDYRELKSHSSLLTNERIAIMFYMLDLNSINLNITYAEKDLLRVKAIIFQLYKNVRSLLREHAFIKEDMNLLTKDDGIYTLDVAFDKVEKMILYCNFYGFTFKRCYLVAQHLNAIELIIRDTLQYLNYFFRYNVKTKPDILNASEKYKAMADELTLSELQGVVGHKNLIDFDKLTTKKLEKTMMLEQEDFDEDDLF